MKRFSIVMSSWNKESSMVRIIKKNPVDRYSCFILSAILVLGMLLRVLALLSLKGSIYFDFLLWDERLYHTWAAGIADGTFQSSSVYQFPPLAAYIMAFVYRLFSPDILYIRILNIILGVLTCYLVYLIGKEMANRKIGLFASLIAALYKPFIFYSIVPLKASLSVFLFALTIYLFTSLLNNHSHKKLFFLGIIAGLMLNVRPNCIILIPFFILFILWNMYKESPSLRISAATILLYTVGLAVSLAPFIVRNYEISGEFTLTTSQSGYNLYLGNNLQNPGPYYYPVPFASSNPLEQGTQFAIEASRRAGRKLSPREASAYWSRDVIRTALEHPGSFARKTGQKILALLNRFEAGDHYHIGFLSDFVLFFKFPFISLGLILPLGAGGMAITMFGSRKSFFLGAVLILYGLTLVIFFTTTRYRLPMLVLLIPFMVMGINSQIAYIRERRRKCIILYACTVLVFFMVEYFPVEGSDDLSAYYNTHAIILNSLGLEEEAMRYWEKSSDMKKPSSACADYALAVKHIMKGDMDGASRYLDQINEGSFFAAPKYELIGDVMMNQGKIDTGLSAYDRSLEINSGQRRVRMKRVAILGRIDKQRALLEQEKLEYIQSFYGKIQGP